MYKFRPGWRVRVPFLCPKCKHIVFPHLRNKESSQRGSLGPDGPAESVLSVSFRLGSFMQMVKERVPQRDTNQDLKRWL